MSYLVDTKEQPSSDSKEQSGEKETKTRTPGSHMATIHDDDERLLAQIGYEQVFPYMYWTQLQL